MRNTTDNTAAARNSTELKRRPIIVISPTFRLLKRCFDIVVSLIGMIVFSPFVLVIFIAIKLEDRGTVIFRQERIGYMGRPFTMYKFRSMTQTAEADGIPTLCKGKGDKRLTHVGHFLRQHHLDEFPQLWNVLKGEMSLVGYRPERKFFVEQIKAANPDYELLYQIRPGLFSTATLYNGYTDNLDKMLARLDMDLEYLHNHSIWVDLRIIFITMLAIFSGKKF